MTSFRASLRPTRLIHLLNGLLLGFVAIFGWHSWHEEKDEQLRQLQTVLELSQKSLDRYFVQLETGLRGLSLDIQHAGGAADTAPAQELLRRFSELHPENVSINYVLLDGHVLTSSSSTPRPSPSIAGGASFAAFVQALRPDTRLELGRPFFGPASQQWVFPIRYVVRDAAGQAVGALSALLPVALLQDFWSQAPMNDGILIGLMRDDGYLLSRYPLSTGASLSDIYGEPRHGALRNYLIAHDLPSRGYVEGYNTQGRADYGNAFARLDHYPATVFVAIPTSQFTLGWWQRVRVPFLLVALLGGTGISGYYFILRTDRARELERRRSEAVLREGEAKQRFLLDHMLAGVVEHGADGRVLHSNAQACHLLGLTLDQMFGREVIDPTWRFLREDGSPMPVDEYPVPRVMAAGTALHGMVLGLLRAGNQEPAWILCDGYPDVDERGNLRRVIVTFVDISSRRRIEQTLARSEYRFRMLYENSLDGVLQTRPDGTILAANAAACKLFGMSEAELRSRGRARITDLSDPRLAPLLAKRDRDGHARGEITMIRRDGSRFEADISSATFADEANHILSSVFVRDVTDRRRTEEALVARELAERANRAKSEFVARMSHELRTPLHAILGFSEVLTLDTLHPLTPLQRDRLGQIRDAGGHLLLLINEVLDLSRIESGTMVLNIESIDLLEVAQEAARDMSAEAQAAGIALIWDRPQAAPGTVLVDRVRIKQVILNLISNAIKYNAPGGRVELGLAQDGREVRLSVRDSGIGMTRAQIDALYRPFDRLGREKSPVQGTGIGLVISRNLVELMHGRIEVQSEPERGSEFAVVLPACARPAAQTLLGSQAHGSAAPRRIAARGHVLYIDDDIVNRVLMQAFVGLRPGVRLSLSSNGPDGLALASGQHPDLILVDMMMPGMDGIAVLRALRADPVLGARRCIAISANAMQHEIDAALAAGFDGYLTKPLSAPLLLAEIDRELGSLTPQDG